MRTFEQILQSILQEDSSPTIILAISGGVDSMVLLHRFMLFCQSHSNMKGIVAHVNHQLRQESHEEEQFLKEWCKRHGFPFYVKRWEVPDSFSNGMEEAARKFRYQFFAEMMQDMQAKWLMTAHHVNDQAETMLMKMVRGTTLQAMKGIVEKRPFSNGWVIRPLLGETKSSIRDYAKHHQVDYVEDASNVNKDYQRNRYRLDILPLLAQENRNFPYHFLELSKQIADLIEVAQPTIEQWQKKVSVPTSGGYCIEQEKWLTLSQTAKRCVMYSFIDLIAQQYQVYISLHHIPRMMEFIEQTGGSSQLSLNHGWQMKRVYEKIYLEKLSSMKVKDQVWQIFSEGIYSLSETEYLEVKKVTSETPVDAVVVSKNTFPLIVRHRKDGDKICIQQYPVQHKKVARFMIDEKIAKEEREKIWLLVNSDDQILAILGYRQSSVLFNLPETDKIAIIYKKKY